MCKVLPPSFKPQNQLSKFRDIKQGTSIIRRQSQVTGQWQSHGLNQVYGIPVSVSFQVHKTASWKTVSSVIRTQQGQVETGALSVRGKASKKHHVILGHLAPDFLARPRNDVSDHTFISKNGHCSWKPSWAPGVTHTSHKLSIWKSTFFTPTVP